MLGSIHRIPEGGMRSGMSAAFDAAAFLWECSRDLFIPICCICFFVCISNIFLLIHEGFRLNNFLGFIITTAYLVMVNALWVPLSTFPDVVTPLLILDRMVLCYAECTFLAICILGYAVLNVKPDHDKDFIIILGCSISKKGKLRPLIKGRVNRAIRFTWEQEWKTGKSSKYIPSGGQGPDEPMSEGSAMEMYLLSHGAEDYEVIAEKQSRNTKENLEFSKKIMDGIKENAKAVVVTTNYHVLRSGMLSRRAGLDAQIIGSETKWYFWPNAFLREAVAIMFMYVKVHAVAALICALIAFLV
jgi:vancomycin permeability regulator SanA